MPANRRSGLFNLYSFNFRDSYQKLEQANNQDFWQIEYKIPTLILKNVHVRNMLYDN